MSNAKRRRDARKPVTRKSLASAIERESRRLLGHARELGDEGASRPLDGPWSVRDVLAHAVYWQGTLARLMGSPLPQPPWLPRVEAEAELGRDEINSRSVDHYTSVRWETLLTDFEFTADLVRSIVGQMKENNLLLEAGEPWPKGTLVWEAIASETHAHWSEHSQRLEAALRSGQGTKRSNDHDPRDGQDGGRC